MPITPLPTPVPTRADPSNFAVRGDAFLAALPAFATETEAARLEINENTAICQSAAQTVNVTAWVSTTNYAPGDNVYDTTDFLTYRRKVAGIFATRPGLDSARWQLLTGFGNVTLSDTQTLTSKTLTAPTITGAGAAAFGNLSYTGTLTGGTGVLNFGSGQFFKGAAGDIGIGTSAPSGRLQIDVGTASNKIVNISNGSTNGMFLAPGSGADGAAVGSYTNHPLRFHTNNVERARIDSSGQQSSVIPGGLTLYPGFQCRAWVNFNGAGTVAIRASGNVSSITDNGVGDYTVNLTAPMPDGNYSAVGNCSAFGASRQDSRISFPLNTGPFDAASCQVLASYGGASAFDPTTVTLSIFR